MKKRTYFMGLILSILGITATSQIYTPSGIIQGSSGNNNVGIGISNPVQPLQVSSNGRTGLQIGGPGSSTGAVADLLFRTKDNTRVGGASYWCLSFRTDSWSNAPGDLVLYSNNNTGQYTSPIIL